MLASGLLPLKWHDIDHGTGALVFAYAVIAVSMLLGLWCGRAGWRKYLALPIVGIPTLIAGGLVTESNRNLGCAAQ